VWGKLTEPGAEAGYWRSFWRALRFFRQEKVQVIHVNGAAVWRPAELLAARLLRIPIVVHYHVIHDTPPPAMRWCKAAIAVSRYTAEHSGPSNLPKPVVYNGIDLARFDAGHSLRGELGIAEDAVVVAYLGQIREIKGVADFIAMARRIPNPKAVFLLAGECRDPKKYAGSYTEADLAAMAGGDERIRYVGYIENVENIYHTADIVVVPSRWQEPLGLINLEAAACRRPVVATRVGGIPEVVRDGVTGLLVRPGDIHELVSAVGQLIASPDLRRRMGRAGRQMVEEEFTTRSVRDFERLLVSFARSK
jgi:glycosyltransferase involved in cell wall biosynthesis